MAGDKAQEMVAFCHIQLEKTSLEVMKYYIYITKELFFAARNLRRPDRMRGILGGGIDPPRRTRTVKHAQILDRPPQCG